MKVNGSTATCVVLIVAFHLASLLILSFAQQHDIGDSFAAFLGLDADRVPRVLENGTVIMVRTAKYKLVAGFPYDAWLSSICSLQCLVAIWIVLGRGKPSCRILAGTLVLSLQCVTLICLDVFVLGFLELASLREEIQERTIPYVGSLTTNLTVCMLQYSRRKTTFGDRIPTHFSFSDFAVLAFLAAASLGLGRFGDVASMRALQLGFVLGLVACVAVWVVSPISLSRWLIGVSLMILLCLLPKPVTSLSSQYVAAVLTVVSVAVSIIAFKCVNLYGVMSKNSSAEPSNGSG